MLYGSVFSDLFTNINLCVPVTVYQSRGMQSTIYVEMASGVTADDLHQKLKSTYEVCVFRTCSLTSWVGYFHNIVIEILSLV